MGSIFKSHHGMNIVGQGGKIIFFMQPAPWRRWWCTRPCLGGALPASLAFCGPGLRVVLPGLALWGTAIVQLLRGFPRAS
jgi:hypothetical protein